MISCDVCEKFIAITEDHEGKIICPSCNFDNSYQLEDNEMSSNVMDFIEEFYDVEESSLLEMLTERYGITHDDALNFLYDYDESDDPSITISKRKYNR